MPDNEVVDPMEEFLSDETGVEEAVTPTEADTEEEAGTEQEDASTEEKEADVDVEAEASDAEAETAAKEKTELSAADKSAELSASIEKELAAFKAKALDETRKRQALEQKLAEKDKAPLEFDWDNPEKTLEAVREEMRAENQARLLDMSEAGAQARHEDYGEKYEIFVSMAQENPALVQTMLTKPDPAEYAYQMATQRIFHDEVGADPKTYEDKMRAKIRQEVEAEFAAKASSKKALADSLPPSANSLTDKTTPVDTIKDPYDDLFPGQHRS